jgi:hypothetical protein
MLFDGTNLKGNEQGDIWFVVFLRSESSNAELHAKGETAVIVAKCLGGDDDDGNRDSDKLVLGAIEYLYCCAHVLASTPLLFRNELPQKEPTRPAALVESITRSRMVEVVSDTSWRRSSWRWQKEAGQRRR